MPEAGLHVETRLDRRVGGVFAWMTGAKDADLPGSGSAGAHACVVPSAGQSVERRYSSSSLRRPRNGGSLNGLAGSVLPLHARVAGLARLSTDLRHASCLPTPLALL